MSFFHAFLHTFYHIIVYTMTTDANGVLSSFLLMTLCVVTCPSYYLGKRKRQNSVDDILHYMEKTDARAEEREAERNRREEERDERMLQDMQQSNTALMGLMERLVSSIETANRGGQGQGQ